VLGRTEVHWRDGFRRMVEARHPELIGPDKSPEGLS
jgi:UDP-glucuronate 4-epimerase